MSPVRTSTRLLVLQILNQGKHVKSQSRKAEDYNISFCTAEAPQELFFVLKGVGVDTVLGLGFCRVQGFGLDSLMFRALRLCLNPYIPKPLKRQCRTSTQRCFGPGLDAQNTLDPVHCPPKNQASRKFGHQTPNPLSARK